jgi:hypothetical protein
MTVVHWDLAAGRWFELPLVDQLAHVGSEIERTFWFDNRDGSSDESWRRYFHAFTHAAAIAEGK